MNNIPPHLRADVIKQDIKDGVYDVKDTNQQKKSNDIKSDPNIYLCIKDTLNTSLESYYIIDDSDSEYLLSEKLKELVSKIKELKEVNPKAIYKELIKNLATIHNQKTKT